MGNNYTVLHLFFLKRIEFNKTTATSLLSQKYSCNFCSRKKNLSFYEQQKQSSEKGIVSVLPLPKVTKPLCFQHALKTTFIALHVQEDNKKVLNSSRSEWQHVPGECITGNDHDLKSRSLQQLAISAVYYWNQVTAVVSWVCLQFTWCRTKHCHYF